MFVNLGAVSTGIIDITFLGGIKQCKSMVNLREFNGFPINSALFGLVYNIMTPEVSQAEGKLGIMIMLILGYTHTASSPNGGIGRVPLHKFP